MAYGLDYFLCRPRARRKKGPKQLQHNKKVGCRWLVMGVKCSPAVFETRTLIALCLIILGLFSDAGLCFFLFSSVNQLMKFIEDVPKNRHVLVSDSCLDNKSQGDRVTYLREYEMCILNTNAILTYGPQPFVTMAPVKGVRL